ncbi:MAG: GNAT family N-acetyltransferase [Candidatus Solincola sediminis]|uniref:GNAT family N-acetyltransferase n=1 Tax=Candidatus Solincola sediminis TaxID=1797199 RepID=A0A1F2WGH6_9ACTN|nr:MAG: GNAT family N-acetyltransferase [Candidatus Solincola sediminis]OFW56242.1 MAG: GNAT family N-acetyltransferase [Candidatus Solincola sediminis]
MLTIGAERKEDIPSIREINLQAFGQEDEALLVERLRNSPSFIPQLSLVAYENGRAVGHAMFTHLKIDAGSGSIPALGLAPVAVLPAYQNQGMGRALIERGINDSREMGHEIVIVVGHPEYYPRFGFKPARAAGLECLFPVPDEAFMVLELTVDALDGISGTVVYPPEFHPCDFSPPKADQS